jgi:hypothetical protein
MLSSIKPHQFIEENISISSGNKTNIEEKNPKKIPIIRRSKEKNDIIIDLSSKNSSKKEEDENSAEYSAQILREEKEIKYKAKTTRQPVFKTKKEYERFTERLKERTMRLELEKINKETERFNKEYEEKNSFKYLFDNPQFQKMLKMVQKQLLLIFIIAVFILILNSTIYFNLTKKKFWLSLVNMALTITSIAIFLVLIISINMGLLNDPDLSKAIRLFILFEFFLQIVSFIFNIIIPFLLYDYLYKLSKLKIGIVYLLFILIFLLNIFSFKFCYMLFLESFLILLNKKTEYAILMINDQNNNNVYNMNINLSTSNIGLTQTESSLITDNERKSRISKDDEKYRNYHYYNRFHYNVTSDRKEPNYFKYKKI